MRWGVKTYISLVRRCCCSGLYSCAVSSLRCIYRLNSCWKSNLKCFKREMWKFVAKNVPIKVSLNSSFSDQKSRCSLWDSLALVAWIKISIIHFTICHCSKWFCWIKLGLIARYRLLQCSQELKLMPDDVKYVYKYEMLSNW